MGQAPAQADEENVSDDELHRRSQAGDHLAWEKLVERYQTKFLRFARRHSGNLHAADDIVQECWRQLWVKRSEYNPVRSPWRTWGYTLLAHEVANYFRRLGGRRMDQTSEPSEQSGMGRAGLQPARRQRTLSGEFLEDRVDENAVDPPGEACRNELGAVIRACLESLSANDQEILELRFCEGLTIREVGERVGIPLGTANNRINRAKAELKDRLRERGITEVNP